MIDHKKLIMQQLEAIEERRIQLAMALAVIEQLEESQPKPEPVEKPKVRVKAARAKAKPRTSVRDDVISFMETNPGPVKSSELIAATGRPDFAVWAMMSEMTKDGTVVRSNTSHPYTYTLNREPTA